MWYRTQSLLVAGGSPTTTPIRPRALKCELSPKGRETNRKPFRVGRVLTWCPCSVYSSLPSTRSSTFTVESLDAVRRKFPLEWKDKLFTTLLWTTKKHTQTQRGGLHSQASNHIQVHFFQLLDLGKSNIYYIHPKRCKGETHKAKLKFYNHIYMIHKALFSIHSKFRLGLYNILLKDTLVGIIPITTNKGACYQNCTPQTQYCNILNF